MTLETMQYFFLNKGGRGVKSPADSIGLEGGAP